MSHFNEFSSSTCLEHLVYVSGALGKLERGTIPVFMELIGDSPLVNYCNTMREVEQQRYIRLLRV